MFGLGALLWGILGGLFVAVIALIAATIDVSAQRRSYGISSRISGSSSSRKLEFVALLIPTIGVVALNQLVLTTAICDVTSGNFFDVAGLQWYWTFSGTDVAIVSVISVGDLFGLSVSSTIVVAVGTILGVLSAVDVIHAFALPTLSVKADAIPGRSVVLRISTENAGSFAGQCSELCGAMHGFMPIAIVAVGKENCQEHLTETSLTSLDDRKFVVTSSFVG